MSGSTTVGLAQWRALPGRAQENLETALDHVATLAARGCDWVVLPELWPSGYDPTTLAQDARAAAEPLDGPRGRRLAQAAAEHGVWLFAGTVPELAPDGRLHNTLVVHDPSGAVRAVHRKVHLYHPLGEHEVFAAGTTPTVLDVDGVTVGLSTCFDGDRPSYARSLRRLGADVVVSCSAYEVGAARWWDVLYPANALVNGQWWVMVNQCGGEGRSALLGASRVIAPDATVVTEAVRWGDPRTVDGTDLRVVELDLATATAAAHADAAALWLTLDGSTAP